MIAIISAMNEEINEILNIIEEPQSQILAGFYIVKGRIASKEVVVCECGIGKVNSAVCATILFTQFEISELIFTGVAGAINKDLDIGDVVVSKDLMYHDFDVTAFGYEIGQVPRMESSIFEADERLIQIALQASNQLPGERTVLTGRILSGDKFVAESGEAKSVFHKLKGDCVEMEGASVAHTCYLFGVPYVFIRIMSDKADSDAKVDFHEFVKKSSMMLKEIVFNMLEKL